MSHHNSGCYFVSMANCIITKLWFT